MVKRAPVTKAEVMKSRSIDRGALAMRIYRECKSKGMMRKDGSPSIKAIQKVNAALDKYDRDHMINGGKK
jgi:fibrillarin-like rRNA methylase